MSFSNFFPLFENPGKALNQKTNSRQAGTILKGTGWGELLQLNS